MRLRFSSPIQGCWASLAPRRGGARSTAAGAWAADLKGGRLRVAILARHDQLRSAAVLDGQLPADQEPLRQPARVHAGRKGGPEPRHRLEDRARQHVRHAHPAQGREIPQRRALQRRGGRGDAEEGRRSAEGQERLRHHVLREGLDRRRSDHTITAELQRSGAGAPDHRPPAVPLGRSIPPASTPSRRSPPAPAPTCWASASSGSASP